MSKSFHKFKWFSFVPQMILTFLTIILLISGIIPLYYLWFTLIGWILIHGLGAEVGYHRVFSHRNYFKDLPKWKENVILLLATLSGQGSSITWAAVHRGSHHRHSDTKKDLHSPTHGLWNSFIGWATSITEKNNPIQYKYVPDLLKRKNHVWFHRYNILVMWTVPLFIAAIDWKFALTGIVLAGGISFILMNSINVICHSNNLLLNYKNFNLEDNSNNNFLLGYIGWGLGWHNNHHSKPTNYDLGTGISSKWWEVDPAKIFLPFIKSRKKIDE